MIFYLHHKFDNLYQNLGLHSLQYSLKCIAASFKTLEIIQEFFCILEIVVPQSMPQPSTQT